MIIEEEIIETFGAIISGIEKYSKNNIRFRKDWANPTQYTAAGVVIRKTASFAIVKFCEGYVHIRSLRGGGDKTIEYVDPKCNAKDLAEVLDMIMMRSTFW